MIETNFKHTDIGLIPHDWEVKTLGDLLSICNGRDYKHLSQGSIPVYGTGGIIAMVNDYLYDGEKWALGVDTWDGIIYADEPEWGIQRACNIQRTEYGVFKTRAEAIDYKNKKLKERLEF